LDYPPFFAYFEWFLSQWAFWVDPAMVHIQSLNHDSWSTLVFQRCTVIVSELLLWYAVQRLAQSTNSTVWTGLVFLSPGLLMVDHIHFQYNGFMYGIQLLSLSLFLEGNLFYGGLLFAILLNFKHIYLYQAPAYFVYLLSGYCFVNGKFSIHRFVGLGMGVMTICVGSFGPFYAHLPQIVSRLFPFKRGLCHSYWAANVWAIYSFMDRLLVMGNVGWKKLIQ
jgi:alpha-1,3-glucosyltransferase